MHTVSVVIPVFNERSSIERVISLVRDQSIISEIIVVDDGSTDGTVDILKKIESSGCCRVFYNEKNRGKGAALRKGLQGVKSDIIIIQDADLEYDPADYQVLLDPILSGRADVVYGSRFLGGPHRVLYFWHYAANRFLTFLSNMINNLNLTDMEVCYKVFHRSIVEKMDLKCDRFGFEPEITAKVSKLGLRIYEVPIRYYGRTYAEGKKIGWKDGLAAIWWILRFGLFS